MHLSISARHSDMQSLQLGPGAVGGTEYRNRHLIVALVSHPTSGLVPAGLRCWKGKYQLRRRVKRLTRCVPSSPSKLLSLNPSLLPMIRREEPARPLQITAVLGHYKRKAGMRHAWERWHKWAMNRNRNDGYRMSRMSITGFAVSVVPVSSALG